MKGGREAAQSAEWCVIGQNERGRPVSRRVATKPPSRGIKRLYYKLGAGLSVFIVVYFVCFVAANSAQIPDWRSVAAMLVLAPLVALYAWISPI